MMMSTFTSTFLTSAPSDEDATGLDPAANASEEGKELIESILEALPRIGIAIAIVIATFVISAVVRRVARKRLAERRSESFARVFGRMISWAVTTVGLILAVTVTFPSIQPVDLIAGLGIFSIAIGFAFQDILSNMLAGILLLIREPFEPGDQIEVQGQRGTVQKITIRETEIKTFDGEKVVIPNADVYQNVIRVQTAYGPKRSVIGIGLDDWEDFDRVTDVLTEAVGSVDGVLDDPAPQVYFTEFGDSTTNLEVRYWTAPEQAEVRRVQDGVVRAIGRGLKDNDISMPSPIREVDARSSVADLVGGG